jgi:hypothetical protein
LSLFQVVLDDPSEQFLDEGWACAIRPAREFVDQSWQHRQSFGIRRNQALAQVGIGQWKFDGLVGWAGVFVVDLYIR